MPILDIEIVTSEQDPPIESLAKPIADAAGEIFGSVAGQTWVKVRGLDADHYAENGNSDQHIYPVFITVLKGGKPKKEELKEEIKRLTQAVAKICNRSVDNVHLIYLPEGAGRVSFGGKLVE